MWIGTLCYAIRNLQKVDVLPSLGLNVYSMLLRDKLVLSIGAGGDTVAGLRGLTHPLAVLY